MLRIQGKMLLLSGAIFSLLLLQACSQNSAAEGSGEAFAAAAETSHDADGMPQAQVSASHAPQASADAPEVTAQPSPAPAKPGGTPVVLPPSPAASPAASAKRAAEATLKPSILPGGSTPSPVAVAAAPATRQPAATAKAAKAPTAPAATIAPKAAPVPSPAASSSLSASSPPAKVANTTGAVSAGNTEIGWNGFFDGDDQTRPSEHFWDLSSQQVTIKGFMGEVLSFEKNWFLLIPEPGAECPFDNGDETYWNKIMIVFVPEGSKLRYTSGPLEISGRLDVGIKIDESGYKTMFRLYDASFKSL